MDSAGHPPGLDDDAIATAMRALLAARDPHASICPSEVARHLHADEAAWRALMPRVRHVAVTLWCLGQVRITRHGEDVAPRQLEQGPIRIARGPGFPD